MNKPKSNCEFVSVWDGGREIRTPACYDKETGLVESLKSVEADDLDVLDREFIELPDDSTETVCPHCHEFVLRPCILADEVGKSLYDGLKCPNPECQYEQ